MNEFLFFPACVVCCDWLGAALAPYGGVTPQDSASLGRTHQDWTRWPLLVCHWACLAQSPDTLKGRLVLLVMLTGADAGCLHEYRFVSHRVAGGLCVAVVFSLFVLSSIWNGIVHPSAFFSHFFL